MKGEKLKGLLHTIECEPIHNEIGSLISGEIKELPIAQVKYKSQKGRVLIKISSQIGHLKRSKNNLNVNL